jgi:hypothetical protein
MANADFFQQNTQVLSYGNPNADFFQQNIQVLYIPPPPRQLYVWVRQTGLPAVQAVTPLLVTAK